MKPFNGWIATLSNGENIFERPPVPGERSAWQKLIGRLHAEGLKITSLRLQNGRHTIHALPSKRCQGYYQAFEATRILYRDGGTLLRQGCGSVVGDQVFITWIDQDGNVWQDVRPLSTERIHTTLRDPV